MWKGLPYKGLVYCSVLLNIFSAAAIAVLVFVLKGSLPPVVPVLYGLPVGTDQLTPSLGLLFVPLTGLIITAINILVTTFSKDLFLKRSLIISAAFISLLLTITIIKVILLVGFF